MPDFERLTDKLSIDLATSSEQVARSEGFVAGKTTARKQVAVLAAVIAVLTILLAPHLSRMA